MKKYILLFLLLGVFYFNSFAQDYYYYEGRRIDLSSRNDKIAVILNKTNLDKSYIEQTLNLSVKTSAEIKEIAKNYYLINFTSPISEAEIDLQISSFQSVKEFVKFATKVYYGETRKVTQIPTDEFIVKLIDLKEKPKLNDLNIDTKLKL